MTSGSSSDGRLVVGRASAGSGKTFNLTLEYIRLLVARPDNYRRILAVTFTNKATTELKTRIIETLYAISRGDEVARPYVERLITAENDEETIRTRLSTALVSILHDYSHFRIETIDSFFQSIIRELARELNLTANLKVDIDTDDALEEAVALMIDGMKRGDATFNAVVGYVNEKMNRDKPGNWKIDSELTKFSTNIFNEQYLKAEKEIRQATTSPQFYAKYRQALQQTKRDAETTRLEIASKYLQYIESQGLRSEDFVGGKTGVFSYFAKVAAGKTPTIPKLLRDDPEAPWLKDALMWEQHSPMLLRFMNNELMLRRLIATIEAKLKHANQMELLNKVDDTLRQQNELHNRFILADTAHRLQEIMNDSDAPFIMEKAAAQFRYIMIDEFQDTSELQWMNFQPLIKECLAEGCQCIVVGDVKQSIYRWRNSDWSILNNIEQGSVFASQVDEEHMRTALDTNRRSDEHIVDFNNRFFKQAADDVTTQYETTFGKYPGTTTDIKTAYAETQQKILDKKLGHGYVRIKTVTDEEETDQTADPDTNDGSTTSSEATPMLKAIEETIVDLTQNHGIPYNDIAILTRYNKELKLITQYLKQRIPDIQIVSSEAFQLDSSPTISLMIMAVRAIAGYGQSSLTRFHLGTLALKYQTIVKHNTRLTLSECYESDEPTLSGLLPEGFLDHISELQMTPLHQLCEHIYDTFDLHDIEGQSAFIFAFFDHLATYTHDKAADLNSFLQFWDENLHEKTIPADGAEGMQMLTIHRSKGLEFHTVIVPYAGWNMGGKNTVMWCSTDTSAGGPPVIPITFEKGLSETDFKTDYEQEELKNYVDNLNLMYVAFTRAEHNLIVLTPPAPDGKAYTTAHVMAQAAAHMYGQMQHTSDGVPCTDISIGNIEPHTDRESTTSEGIVTEYNIGGISPMFRQSNASREFTVDPDSPQATRQTFIKRGLVVHKLFEMIRTTDDIPRAMSELQQMGVVDAGEFHDEVVADIERAMSNKVVRQWFDPGWTVMNECEIITRDKDGSIITRRPDRVIYNDHETIVIDYKTGNPSHSHVKQVSDYMKLLRQMGMTNVKGYIWYMHSGEIKEVN